MMTKRKYYPNTPWLRHRDWAKSRCTLSNGNFTNYYRNIKYIMTDEEIKELWFKCNANLMIKPQLHRRKATADYSLENCLFVEKLLHQHIHGKGRGGYPYRRKRT